jgi:two-component system cell cycle sensor histidine kinase PleC
VSLTDIADDCHRLMRVRAENKGLEIRQAFEDNLPNVWADERALRQICLNLLSNAIKFTPPKGTITLTTARTEDGGIALTIKDTGPGIPGDEIPRVLSSFGQGSLAHETAEGGTGLGLPITKGLIELHGGSFELNSELRCGTEVTITLPPARVMEDLSDATEPGETGRDRTAPTRAKRRAHAV